MTPGRKYSRDVRIPLVFSVTGHVDVHPDDAGFLKERLERLFKSFGELYPETPLMLLSALADGADRIAARTALECGMKVGPVLPTSPEEYEKTFSGAGFSGNPGPEDAERSITEFRELLDDPNVYSPCVLSRVYRDPRDSYRSVSAYLIANSQILISVWDGNVYDKNLGGTYDTTRMAYSGVDPELLDVSIPSSPLNGGGSSSKYLNITEDCLIYWIGVRRSTPRDKLERKGCRTFDDNHGKSAFIVPYLLRQRSKRAEWTPRMNVSEVYRTRARDRLLNDTSPLITGGPGSVSLAGERIHLDAFGSFPRLYDREFFRIDRFNHDAGTNADKDDSGKLTDTESQKSRPDWDIRFHVLEEDTGGIKPAGLMDDMVLRYNAADQLSVIFRNKSNRSIKFIILTSALMILFFNLFLLMDNIAVLVVLFAVFIGVSRLISILHIRGEEYRKYIEYRSLAESLRVNYYWGLAEVNDTASSSFYQYLRNDTLWIRSALCSWSSYFLNEYDVSDAGPKERVLSIRDSWIRNQLNYHTGKGRTNAARYRRLGLSKKVSTMGLFAISAALVIMQFWDPGVLGSHVDTLVIMGKELEVTVLTLFKLTMIVFSIGATLSNSMFDTIYGGTPNQIESKILMFELADRRSRAAERIMTSKLADTEGTSAESDYIAQMTEIIAELGIQSLDENNDWVFEFKNNDVRKVSLKKMDDDGDGSEMTDAVEDTIFAIKD